MKKICITADTTLAELFYIRYHERLRALIDSWRQYMIDDDPNVDALKMSKFKFDKKRIFSNRVYYDLLDLEAEGALQVSLTCLARYLASHSNLSNSFATLHRQLKKYRKEHQLSRK